MEVFYEILRSLNKKFTSLEYRKSITFFKVVEPIFELGSPPIVKKYTLISIDDLEYELFKLKDKWDGEFNNLLDFFEENIKT